MGEEVDVGEEVLLNSLSVTVCYSAATRAPDHLKTERGTGQSRRPRSSSQLSRRPATPSCALAHPELGAEIRLSVPRMEQSAPSSPSEDNSAGGAPWRSTRDGSLRQSAITPPLAGNCVPLSSPSSTSGRSWRAGRSTSSPTIFPSSPPSTAPNVASPGRRDNSPMSPSLPPTSGTLRDSTTSFPTSSPDPLTTAWRSPRSSLPVYGRQPAPARRRPTRVPGPGTPLVLHLRSLARLRCLRPAPTPSGPAHTPPAGIHGPALHLSPRNKANGQHHGMPTRGPPVFARARHLLVLVQPASHGPKAERLVKTLW